MHNEYIPFKSKIVDIIKHTDIEYTFRMEYIGDVKPGQFFEVSIPKYGEAPISVSGITDTTVDFTIRKVGKVTDEIFNNYTGSSLYLRGPYGNGFNLDNYKNKELIIVAGGTGVSPVRGVIDYFARNNQEMKSFDLIAGFKSQKDILFKEDFESWETTANVILTIDKEEAGYEGKVGLVTKYIPELRINNMSDVECIVVGPPMMMKFAVQSAIEKGIPEEQIWVSHERKMCCGIGKCGHCKIDDKYVCLDGPVFKYTEAKYLID